MSRNQSLKDRPQSPSDFGDEDQEYYRSLGIVPGTEPKTPPLVSSSPTPDDFRPDDFLDLSPLDSPKTPTESTYPTTTVPELTLPPSRHTPTDKVVSVSVPRKQPAPIIPKPPLSKPVQPPAVPKVSVLDVRKRTLKTLPDRASATIQRVVNHRIKKAQRSKRPRMTKNPRSSPYNCRLCQVTCTGRTQWGDHLRSRRHIRRANPQEFKCVDCELTVYSQADLKRHRNGSHHRLRARRFH